MCVRITKLWLWKKIVLSILFLGVVSLVLLFLQSENWRPDAKIAAHAASRQFLINVSDIKKNVSVIDSLINEKFKDKIIMRRKPYITEPACQNYSVSLYEDETFENIGLVSYPGSGNTWARHLIQLASGVYTGSFYFDMDLFARGFFGEREPWYSGRTIVQKFHEKYDKRMNIDRAILIIREPFPAILAFANYLEAGHTGKSYLLPYHHKDWPNFLLQSAYNWLSLAKSWIESSATLLVIHYEHVKSQPVESVAKMCRFLNHSCPYLQSPCFKKKMEGSFHRAGTFALRTMDKDRTRAAKFPPQIKSVISRGIDHLDNLLRLHGHESIPINLYQHYASANLSTSKRTTKIR